MELACSLEKGSMCTQARIIPRPHKPSRASHHVPCSSVSPISKSISVKCASIVDSDTRAISYKDGFTRTFTECFIKAEVDRDRAPATSVSFKVQFGRKFSAQTRRGCKQCDSCQTLRSARVFSFPLDLIYCAPGDSDRRGSVYLGKKQVLSMVLRYSGNIEAAAAQRIWKNRICRTLSGLEEFRAPIRGRRKQRGGYRHVCGASGQDDKGKREPDDDRGEGPSDPVSKKEGNSSGASQPQSEPETDWRAFRARLVVSEQQQTSTRSETESTQDNAADHDELAGPLPKRWAHPILAPETGCVLIATDKIDGQQSFERSVILLLSPGSTHPREGPYGLILNRPLSCRIKDIKPKDRTLVKFFGNCQVHHGGPLDEDMFLLLHGTEGVRGYREVIPGVYYGAASGLEEIMRGRRPLDYRFFFGYSGWSVDQLKREIDQGLWCVAACSTDLITGHSAARLWEEILMLMGGKYAELSKRPRRKHF
ncbi:hypothetical protein R1flu_010219 [Riccia fluitans]|uniref:Uncharacterized protein n=1 Tax=Riccia fluitans TaxID=41844 RepID=A0ABD1Z8K4_9MARC